MNFNSTHFSIISYLPALHHCSMSTKRIKRHISLFYLSWFSITSLFSLVAFKAALCHFVQFSIENELLIWFKDSEFWYSVSSRPWPIFLLGIVLYPEVIEILRLWFHRTSPVILSHRWSRVGVGQLKSLDASLGDSWIGYTWLSSSILYSSLVYL